MLESTLISTALQRGDVRRFRFVLLGGSDYRGVFDNIRVHLVLRPASDLLEDAPAAKSMNRGRIKMMTGRETTKLVNNLL